MPARVRSIDLTGLPSTDNSYTELLDHIRSLYSETQRAASGRRTFDTSPFRVAGGAADQAGLRGGEALDRQGSLHPRLSPAVRHAWTRFAWLRS